MIPLKDDTPRYSIPFVTILLIATNAIIFLYQVSLGPRLDQKLVFEYGVIPARIDAALAGHAQLGGWLHLIGNMWFLWIFGDNVEDALGHFGYLVFYLSCGVASGVVHTIANWGSRVPALGASGAIAGVMGAYIVFYPRARVLTLVPLIIFFFTVRLPAAIILGYWFLIQFLSGVGSLGVPGAAGVAWWAHIGGFALGALIAALVKRPYRPSYA
jgi:membrane associated rhomboid family serine protease